MLAKRMPDARVYAESCFFEEIKVLEETEILRSKVVESSYPSLKIFLENFLNSDVDAIETLKLWKLGALATNKGIKHLKQVLQEETEKETSQFETELAKLKRMVVLSSYESMEVFLQHLFGINDEKRVAIVSLKAWSLKELMTEEGIEWLKQFLEEENGSV